MQLPASLEKSRVNAYGTARTDIETVAVAVSYVADKLTMAQAAMLSANNPTDFKGDPYTVFGAVAQMLGDMAQTLNDASEAIEDLQDEAQAS